MLLNIFLILYCLLKFNHGYTEMFNSRHRFNYRPGQVGICLQAWRMLERHFHKCSFQGSGRGQGDIRITILLFARAPVCVMPFYSPVVVSFSITISFNFSARPDSFQHIEHVRHSMVDWQRGKNKQRPVASDSDGH